MSLIILSFIASFLFFNLKEISYLFNYVAFRLFLCFQFPCFLPTTIHIYETCWFTVIFCSVCSKRLKIFPLTPAIVILWTWLLVNQSWQVFFVTDLFFLFKPNHIIYRPITCFKNSSSASRLIFISLSVNSLSLNSLKSFTNFKRLLSILYF